MTLFVAKEDATWGQVPLLRPERIISNTELDKLFKSHLAKYKIPKVSSG